MSTNVELLTSDGVEGITKEEFVEIADDQPIEAEIRLSSFILPLPILEEITMAISVLSFEIMLNSIILRC